MKITTNPGSIIAACKAGLAAFAIEEQQFQAAEAARRKSWWYRNCALWVPSPVDYEAKRRVQALLAIALHKRDAFSLELDEPWLTDIAVYLDPFVGGRI